MGKIFWVAHVKSIFFTAGPQGSVRGPDEQKAAFSIWSVLFDKFRRDKVLPVNTGLRIRPPTIYVPRFS